MLSVVVGVLSCMIIVSAGKTLSGTQDSKVHCPEGYYCHKQNGGLHVHNCGGVDLFCPEDSHSPTEVKEGHYTIGLTELTRTGEKVCEPGTYCVDGVQLLCPPGR